MFDKIAVMIEKIAVMIKELREALEADQLDQWTIKSLYGKLDHVKELVPEDCQG